MPFGLILYRIVTWLITPFLGVFFRRRAKAGKEAPERIPERFGYSFEPAPTAPVIWFHAASVGESKLQLALARRLSNAVRAEFLFTCQTMTAATTIATAISDDALLTQRSARQVMAPVDTLRAVNTFLDYWQPQLAIFAEGEIWPNLLLELERRSINAALINARMTEKSILGWMRWEKSARRVFASFDLIIAADLQTQTALGALSGHAVSSPGNLKSALPPPSVDDAELRMLETKIGDRAVLLAASTHAGEEALILDAFMSMGQRPLLILAPRHPERGDEVAKLLALTNFACARRSDGDPITAQTDILLADTMGEMGLWYRLADTVYLGGGHSPGVGGHNPLEALQLGKPVITGPSVFNFKDLVERLAPHQGFEIVDDTTAIVGAFPSPPVSDALQQMIAEDAIGPMTATLDALNPLLPARERP
ncbi:MAG: glycosyltransferase N-terminal domain-containing protein, partial [Pseudomonadota bacterium]